MPYVVLLLMSISLFFIYGKNCNGKVELLTSSIISALVIICLIPIFTHFIGVESKIFYYYVVAAVLCFFAFKQKNKIPSLKMERADYVMVLFLAIIFIIFFFHSKLGKEVHFISVDPVGHFDMALTFAKNKYLLIDKQSELFSYTTYPPFFYTVAGFLFGDVLNKNNIDFLLQFNVFNFCLLTILAVQIFCVCKAITPNNLWLALFFSILIIIGHPLDIYFSGYAAQMLGLIFIVGITASLISPYEKSPRILQNALLLGLYLSYFYYIPFVVLALFLHAYKNNKELKLTNLIIKFAIYFLPSAILALPMIPYYLEASKAISVSGAMFTDVYLSFLIFIPGIFLLLSKRNYKDVEFFLISALLFAVVMFALRVANISSVYYFFKIYSAIYIFMGFCALKAISSKSYQKIIFSYLFAALPLLVLAPKIQIDLLSTKNYFVMESNLKFLFKNKIFDTEQLLLISNLNNLSKPEDSVCMASESPLQLMWFVELTNGKYFRGHGDTKHLWMKDATWQDMNKDAQCKLPNYDYIIDFSCNARDLHKLVENPAGCIFKSQSASGS